MNPINMLRISSICLALLFAAQASVAQTEKLGTVSYRVPKGFTKTLKPNIVAFSKYDQETGKFCIITLYGATPGTGSPSGDFKREWKKLVVDIMKAEPDPKTESQDEQGWVATGAGSPVEFAGANAFALLTVISAGNRTVSILGVFNDKSLMAPLAAFSDSIALGKPMADAAAPQPADKLPAVSNAPLATSINAAGLVKEFENNEIRANQQYIGKRVRITGYVNIIEINNAGQIVLTFKSSISTYTNARCYFNRSQSQRVAALNANEQATVEGRVKGLGDGFDNSKAYLVLEECTVP